MRTIMLGHSPLIKKPWNLSGKSLFEKTGGNTGNLAFEYAIFKHLGGDVTILPLGTKADVLKELGDIIVIPLANQLGEHTNLGEQAKQLEEAQLPIVGLGLGAQNSDQSKDIILSQGTDRWLRILADHSPYDGPNLGVRGQYTLDQIERLGINGAAVVTGCPSNFINSDTEFVSKISLKNKRPYRRIAVTAGIPFIPRLSGIEQDLADIVTATNGIYVVQHSLDMIRIAMNEFDEIDEDIMHLTRNYIAPHVEMECFKVWCRNYARVFSDVNSWMFDISKFDFVVGTRFHGAMLAIQAGVPAGVIAHDSRTLEMCETMGVPVCRDENLSGGITRRQLRELFIFDDEVYLEKRKKLLSSYLSILKLSGIETTFDSE